MEFLGPAIFSAMILPIMIIAAVPLFIYVYAIVRWRAGVGGEPGIGSYCLVLMFRMFAVLVGLSALSPLVYAMLSSEDLDEMTRVCWPALFASLLFLAVQLVVGAALGPTDRYAPARRIFGGGLVAITGLITFSALVALLVTKWQEVPESEGAARDRTEFMKGCGAWLVCFGSVYLASAMKMARAVSSPPPPPPRDQAAPFA
jgi:uncharacterized BrkB/YihY/UPF0761 family membrane protein